MSWVRSDDNEPNHPKIFRAGIAAYGFFQAAKCYCSRNLTNGFVPVGDLSLVSPSVPFRTAMKLTVKLVECGLFDKQETPPGWRVHDYLDYNWSREQIESRRDQRIEAGRASGRRSADARAVKREAQRVVDDLPDESSTNSFDRVSTPIPIPIPIPKKQKKKEEESPAGTLTASQLIDLFNELTPDETPSVETRSPERLRKASRYVKVFPTELFWRESFAQVHRSEFLRGLSKARNGHESFVADFDWMLSKGKDGTENIVKVHDGKYA